MSEGLPSAPPEPPPRLRRILEVVYLVEGVVGARVWLWESTVAVGVRVSSSATPGDVLRRVQAATLPLQEPGETWELGLLDDETPGPPPLESESAAS